MTVFLLELRRGWKPFVVWCLAVAGMVGISMSLFPSMEESLEEVTSLFANMGSFTAAFGMDQLALGSLTGYYGVENGTILGLGGGMYAAYTAIAVLSKEEGERTAEFLLAHPVRRISVALQKLAAVLVFVLALNLVVLAAGAGSIALIGEEVPWHDLLLLHGGYVLMQVEVAIACFGVSAFLRRGSVGLGLGLVLMLYFANIMNNIGDGDSGLAYITPFAYAEPSTVLDAGSIDPVLAGVGYAAALVIATAGTAYYLRKDVF